MNSWAAIAHMWRHGSLPSCGSAAGAEPCVYYAVARSFLACPQVQQCYYVAGEFDFVLAMACRSMEQYAELTRQLFFESNNVKRFRTLVSMSNVKVGLEVPVDLAADT